VKRVTELSVMHLVFEQDSAEERMQQVQARKQRMIAGALANEGIRSEELKILFR
jgi:DNA repair protein RAD5